MYFDKWVTVWSMHFMFSTAFCNVFIAHMTDADTMLGGRQGGREHVWGVEKEKETDLKLGENIVYVC